MLELVRAGAISPNAEEVAERAGVGLRTVFRRFDDMDSLYREMAKAMRPRCLAALKNDRTFFEALDQALSFSTWQHLRRDQNLTQAQARQTVEYAVHALIGALA